MSEAALDRLLAYLIVAVLATGVMTWRAGSPDTVWVYTAHGVLAGVLLAASGLKLRRSLPRAVANRRWRPLSIAVLLASATLISLGAGFLWVAGGQYIVIWLWTLLGWHGLIGWAVLALMLLHLAMRGRWRLLRPALLRIGPRSPRRQHPGLDGRQATRTRRSISRRALLMGGSLGAIGFLVWGVAGVLDRLSPTPRRFTGSRWLPAGGIPTPTTFLGEGTPPIDQSAWRLRVEGVVDHPLALSVSELEALGTEEQSHVLDCTGSWAMVTTWRGVPMTAVLDAARARSGAQRVEVRSVTGWATSLSLEEARGTLLATGVAGVELPSGNGAPCRLVVPDRRGLDWVKWVSTVTVV